MLISVPAMRQALHLSEQVNPIALAENLGEEISSELRSSKMLHTTTHSRFIEDWINPGSYVEVFKQENGYACFTQYGFVPVSAAQIRRYRLSFDGLMRCVMKALDMPARSRFKEAHPDLWALGDAWIGKKKVSVYFTRRINAGDNFERLHTYLTRFHTSRPALILTGSLVGFAQANALPSSCRLARISDFMSLKDDFFRLDFDRLQELMGVPLGGDGFSPGYRAAVFNGVQYEFTKAQAEVMEALHQAGKPLHKHELMAQTSSSQDDPRGVFRRSGSLHPAWDVVLKNDGKGNYWLEI